MGFDADSRMGEVFVVTILAGGIRQLFRCQLPTQKECLLNQNYLFFFCLCQPRRGLETQGARTKDRPFNGARSVSMG